MTWKTIKVYYIIKFFFLLSKKDYFQLLKHRGYSIKFIKPILSYMVIIIFLVSWS